MIYEFEGRKPQIDPSAYVSPDATVIGDVRIGKDTWIGPGAVLRGDYGTIIIGEGCSIQDNCVCHARESEKCTVGDHVTVGHGAILHTCTVEDYAVVGIGAIVSDWAVAGEWAVVAEGCVVKQSQNIPAGKIAVGIPAKIIGDVVEGHKADFLRFKKIYAGLAERYWKGLKEL